jgi:hypothetical protein
MTCRASEMSVWDLQTGELRARAKLHAMRYAATRNTLLALDPELSCVYDLLNAQCVQSWQTAVPKIKTLTPRWLMAWDPLTFELRLFDLRSDVVRSIKLPEAIRRVRVLHLDCATIHVLHTNAAHELCLSQVTFADAGPSEEASGGFGGGSGASGKLSS